MRHAMIMAGGSGTRLWPLSRSARPKQMIPLYEGRSLLEIAADRLHGLVPPERRLVCTGERFRGAVGAVLPGIEVLGEPMGRDTLNAVGFTAAVLAKRDPDAVFAVLTADHLITPQERFLEALELGFRLVEAAGNRFVTFAITPTFPATGYGYVEHGEHIAGFEPASIARHFKEKPDLETATTYFASGRFGWNSGMFVFRASTVLEAIGRTRPETAAGLARIADAWDTPDQDAVLNEVYPTLEKISVDYALMEPAAADPALDVCVVPMEVDWRDVGSWPSYGETLEPDEHGNRTSGAAHLEGCRDVLAVSDDPARVVTAIGVHDLVIVATKDAILVCPAERAEEVKAMAGRVDEAHR